VIRDQAQFVAHWVPDLEAWFEQGVDTPGLVLIKVHAKRIKFWEGEDEGEVTLAA
jgi:general stress protein 26